MSKRFVEGAIQEFLKSNEPEVLCIRGSWGAGKTYVLNDQLKRAARKGEVAFDRYAYCSLFGVNSLNDLRAAIVERTIRLSKKEKLELRPTTDSVRDMLKHVEEIGRKGSWSFSALASVFGFGGVGGATSRMLFLTIHRQIVCFDDLERRGAGLEINDVLGLASHLKEECGCKVVLILNDEQLGDAHKEIFDKYLEKVVDLSAIFKPTPDECAEVASEGKGVIGLEVAKCVVPLGLTNIRVIRRIIKLAQDVEPTVKLIEPRLMGKIVKALAVLAWIEFMPGEAPPLEFVENRLGARRTREERAGNEDRVRHWHEALDKLEISKLDGLDTVLLKGIRDGYFDTDLVGELADLLSKQLYKRDVEDALYEAWRLCDDRSIKPREFADKLIAAVKISPRYVLVVELDKVVVTLRELGFEGEASSLIQYMVENLPNERRYFNLHSRISNEMAKDLELIRAFEVKTATFTDSRPFNEVVHKVVVFGYETLDMVRLKAASVADYKDVFQALKGYDIDETASKMLWAAEQADNGRAVGENVREALEQIAAQSVMAERRLRPLLDKKALATDAGT